MNEGAEPERRWGGGEEEGVADAKAERKETKVVDSEEIKRHRE